MKISSNASVAVNEDGQIVVTLAIDIDGQRETERTEVFSRAKSKDVAEKIMRAQESK